MGITFTPPPPPSPLSKKKKKKLPSKIPTLLELKWQMVFCEHFMKKNFFSEKIFDYVYTAGLKFEQNSNK